MKFLVFLSAMILFMLPVAVVFPFTEEGLIVSATTLNFDFREYDENSEQKLSEIGWIFGVKGQYKKAYDNLYLGAQYSFSKGLVKYDGETQRGLEHVTQTDETIHDGSIEIGRIYESWRLHDYAVIYLGAGMHRWIRDIKDKNNVAGLFETYTWAYLNIGARGFIYRTKNAFIMVEINVLRTLFPEIEVNYKGIFDNQTLDLGEHYGAKFALPVRYRISNVIYLNIEPYWESWDLGRSKHEPIKDDGVVTTGGVHEPRSASRLFGLNIGVQLLF